MMQRKIHRKTKFILVVTFVGISFFFIQPQFLKFKSYNPLIHGEKKVMSEYEDVTTNYPVIVVGDLDVLVPLTYTPYLAGYPAIAFIDQQNRDSLQSIVGSPSTGSGHSRQSAVNNQILFVNSAFSDLVVDLAYVEDQAKGKRREIRNLGSGVGGQESEARSQKSEVSGQKSLLVKLNKKGRGRFKVEERGMYEVWVKNSKEIEKFKDWGLEVNIDREELKRWEGKEGDKWVKAGEVELEEGKHRIEVRSSQPSAGLDELPKVRDQNKGKSKNLFQEIEIVVASKEKLKGYEDLLKAKDIGYLFYVDKEKTEEMLKDDEKLKEIKLKKENPFSIGMQEFYVPKDGCYSVKALIKPKRGWLEGGFVSSSGSSSSASIEALSGWDVKVLNTTCRQNISEDGMYIYVYFQDKGDVKEGVVLTKKFPDISIKERPYLAFFCGMGYPEVQEIEIDVKLTDARARSQWFETKKIRLKADSKQYVINLYQKAKDIFGRETARNLSINEITLKFKKRDGVDLLRERDRHIYPFQFETIAFSKSHPILFNFGDRLFAYLPDNYHYFDESGDFKSVGFPEQIPWNIKDIYKLRLNRFIDLKETPVLSLNFPKPLMNYWKGGDWRFENEEWRTKFPQEWKITLRLDFDGDEKENTRVETVVPATLMGSGDLLLTVGAYEEVKRRFPDKQNYNLLSLGVGHPDDKEVLYQTVMSKKLIRYREHIYNRQDFGAGAGVLQVDGDIYRLGPEIGGQRSESEGDNDNWIEFNNVQLKEGEHTLNVFENDSFKVEMVEIRPEIRGQGLEVRGQEPPKIEFKKINPTRYVVDVNGAKGPFTLVLSESFHEGWMAYVRQKTEVRSQKSEEDQKTVEPWSALWSAWQDRGNRAEIKDHFVVNGYANGWVVPVIQESGARGQGSGARGQGPEGEDFQIVLEYKPQRLFEIGLFISVITLLGCVGYLIYDVEGKQKRC